jgi:diguanylate cyclase (GGDEF)-like protein
VVLAEVDSIGEMNEKWGREAGHTVLKDFAKVMREKLRSSDMCGRVSDDKFCFIMTHLSNSGIATAIDRCRCPFAEHQFTFGGKIVTATASFGAIRFDAAPAPDFASLVRDAGKALYSAKQAGGNQCRIVSAHKPAWDSQENRP